MAVKLSRVSTLKSNIAVASLSFDHCGEYIVNEVESTLADAAGQARWQVSP